jgi:hypothetical protein
VTRESKPTSTRRDLDDIRASLTARAGPCLHGRGRCVIEACRQDATCAAAVDYGRNAVDSGKLWLLTQRAHSGPSAAGCFDNALDDTHDPLIPSAEGGRHPVDFRLG